MKSWKEYIKHELKREPGILLLAYPYTFLWKPVTEAKVREIWKKSNPSKEKIVYIHIPFCKRKCFFCNFVAYFDSSYNLIRKYVDYLKKEIELTSSFSFFLPTNYFSIGGGTPNLLQEKELEDILKTVHKFMNLKKKAIMSIEIFPDESINANKLKLLKEYGVNRLSFGIQSFDDKIKRICNRFDTRQQNIKIYNTARRMGFKNINFDLMFGLPKQTLRNWIETLTLTVKLKPEHICVSPLTARYSKILFYEYMKTTDVKKTIDMSNLTRDFLTKKGYFQASRHSYVKRESVDIYNDFFSMLTPALGLGLNSVSSNSNFTYKNTPDLKKYFFDLGHNKLPVEKGYVLKGKDKMGNYITRKIGHLRIDRQDFKKHFGKDIKYCFRKVIQGLEKFKLIDIDKNFIRLTQKGIFYEALVKRCFYDFNILRKKEAFYKNISS